jgi:hypothetical protein
MIYCCKTNIQTKGIYALQSVRARYRTVFKIPLGSSILSVGHLSTCSRCHGTFREASLILNTPLEDSVQLHALTYLLLDRNPHYPFLYEAFVPTAGKDVVAMMQSLFFPAVFIWLVYD